MADTKTRKVKQTFRKVKAPGSWANGQWQAAGIPPIRFDENAEAWVLDKEDDTQVTAIHSGPDGPEEIARIDLIASRAPDFDVTSKTKTQEVEVAVD